MLRVQGDIYSSFSDFLAKQVVAAYDHRNQRNPGLDPAVALLRKWNGQMDKDLGAPLLITLIYQHVRRAIAENASSATNAVYEFNLAPLVVERMLRERPAGWFDDYDQMLLRALVDGVEEAQRMQGRDPKRWRYGNYLRIPYSNPVIHQVPLVGKYFDIGPVSMSGSSHHPKADDPDAGAFHADDRRPGRLGAVAAQHHGRAERPDSLFATTATSGATIIICAATRCSFRRCRLPARWNFTRELAAAHCPASRSGCILRCPRRTHCFSHASCLAIVPLAGWLGHATEELSRRTGEGVGGLLNATFGNAAELIIASGGTERGALPGSQGFAHRFHHRQRAAGLRRFGTGRRDQIQDAAVQCDGRAGAGDAADAGRDRPGDAGRLSRAGRPAGLRARGRP